MSTTVASEKESRVVFWVLLAFGILVCFALNALIILDSSSQIAADAEPSNIEDATFLLVLPFLGSILIGVPLGMVLAFIRATRRIGVAILVLSIVFVATSRIAVYEGNRIRMEAFRALAERSMPLVEAVRAYEKAEGRLPGSLQDLVPTYLDTIPGTGLGAYPTYELLTGDDAGMWFDNLWVINVQASRGPLNFDRFMYFPLQNYPQGSGGDRFERLGAWGYMHE